ncbi:MAG TPA: AsmA family protein [Rhizomicrobium sp.]|nr:AsmA family protein [Rhizomicrobium sp.]
MKRRIFVGSAVVTAAIVLLTAVPFLLPAGVYKSQIEQRITRATGRAFLISGPLHFSLFPSLAIQAGQVSLANLAEHPNPFLANADAVKFGIRLWPLFRGRLEITRIVLERPIINLEVDSNGRANWLLKQPLKLPGHESPPRTAMIEQFSGIEIEHGHLNYSNLRSRSAHALEDINATLDLTDLDQPLYARGTFTFVHHRVAFRIKTAAPKLILEERTAATDMSAISDLLRVTFKGTIAPDGVLSGLTELDAASARAAGTWLGAHLPETGGLGPLSLNSHIEGDNRHVRLEAMTLKLDGMTARGNITIDSGADIPHINGVLRVDHLDLNPYIEQPPRQEEKRLRRDGESWSDKPITLDALKKVDADLTLDVGHLALRKLALGKAHITVSLHDAQLDAKLDSISLYGGTGKATLTADARGTPAFHNIMEINQVRLQPFLFATVGIKRVEGMGSIRLNVTSKGDNADAIMHGLNGKGSIDFQGGQVRDVDLNAVGRTVQSFLGPRAVHPEAFTKYATMSGSFVMADGVLASTDLQLTGPVLHMTGAGTVDVGNRTIDFRMVPQASAVIAKQRLSIGLPFRIKGPWEHVRYTADLASLGNRVLDNLYSGRAPFKGLFGNQIPKNRDPEKKKHKNIGDALKNMFGIH